MADIHSIDKKRQADRVIALLGLQAAEEGVSSPCLTDEELAALVDRQCSLDEQDRVFGHLASCSDCYRRWLALSEIIDAETGTETQPQTKKTIHPLFQAKQMAWVGSLLAAAASVVLFINISGDMEGPMLQSQVQPTVELNKAPLSEVQNDKEQENFGNPGKFKNMNRAERLDTVGRKMEIPAAAPSPVPVMEEIEDEQMRILSKQKTRAAVQKSIRVQPAMSDEMAGGDGATIDSVAPLLPVSAWLAGIVQGCRQNNENRQFWKRKYMEGAHRLQPESAEQEKLVNDLLPLLQQLARSTETVAETCGRLTARLDAAADR